MYEVLEHTADIGFRASASALPGLFEQAAEALASIALELDTVEAREAFPLEASGEDADALLVNWLSEALFLLDGRGVAPRRFHVIEMTHDTVRGEALGEPRDPARHRARLVVKGVTYHQLRIVQDAQGWRAEVYLDI